MPQQVYIRDIAKHVGETVSIKGWLYGRTDKGRLQFLLLRDGTGMIQGVSMIVKESVNKGDVQEIKMAEATLIYERSPVYPVACILVASKASKTLRDSLDAFSTKFFHQFGDKLEDSNNVTQFRPAEKLVEECFSFLETSQKK